MAQPPAYNRNKDFTEDFSSETDHSALNSELDTASNSINDIRRNLSILQADDGKLRPSVVTADSISYELRVSLVEGVIIDAQGMLDQSLAAVAASSASAVEAEASRVATADLAAQALDSANAAGNSAAQADVSAGNAADGAIAAQEALDQMISGQVNADWLATESKAEILNKPTTLEEYELQEEVETTINNIATRIVNDAIAEIPKADGVPVGAKETFFMPTPPAGYLVCNGAEISREIYQELFAAIGTVFGIGDGVTTFKLPDMRGEFVSGWDDGRGADPGREFGSWKPSQNLAHTHGVTDPGHAHSINIGVYTGQKSWLLKDGYNPSTYPTNAAFTGITINSSGGNDAFPRHVALLICIKYE